MKVPFNRPFTTGREFGYLQEAIDAGHLSGNGGFTKRCQKWLEEETTSPKALLTHSCTAGLEMAAILADVGPGDEVILPSYTFVSTANAFVLRGATPVFVDVCADTLNIDPEQVSSAITDKTKVICPVHYAGVGADMEALMALAKTHDLVVIEDAAQGSLATRNGRPLGSIGHLGALSFHETKNLISGEGGALLVNEERFEERSEIIWEKGTNRSAFFRGDVDKYTWVDVGSSYLPSELIAAFLWAQFEQAEAITEQRLELWGRYHERLEHLESKELLRRPIIPSECVHNAHMYYVLTRDLEQRTKLLAALRSEGYLAVFHYVPLHSSPAGQRLGRGHGNLGVTTNSAERLVRLPLWVGLGPDDVDKITDIVAATLS